jgi:succinate dehydrogenase / fumarate reductase cytochrome b subunit
MYKGKAGMWAWLFHRVSGLGILVFLLLHIVDVSILSFGPTAYNASVMLFDSVIVRLLSLALVVAILFHGLNGVRVVLIDFWRKGVRYQQTMFVIVIVLCVILFIPAAYYVMGPVLNWFFHIPAPHAAAESH